MEKWDIINLSKYYFSEDPTDSLITLLTVHIVAFQLFQQEETYSRDESIAFAV